MRRFLFSLAVASLPMVVLAQTSGAFDDRDYLTALLEDNLSGAGRQVVITGFEGALSSQAKIAELTIADDLGVWISLKDVTLDWTRSDLLQGKVTVNTLSAAEIDLARLPQSQSDVVAEAAPFALPELPVSVSIGTISAQQLRLGAPVLGQEITASVTAALQLSGGEGQGNLRIERLDENAPTGQADITISFANATRQLMVDVQIAEGAGGILAEIMGVEGAPALAFTAKGDGPLSDFAAQIALASDGVQRFGGSVKMASLDPQTARSGSAFAVDLSGDISPLLAQNYRAFFGSDSTLRASGTAHASGGFDLDALRITAQALDISGRLSVAANGVPSQFDLSAQVQGPSGTPILLPLGLDIPASITAADLRASFDAAQGDTWALSANMAGWQQEDLRIAQTQITGQGTLRDVAGHAQWNGDVAFSSEGVVPARASLSRALGSVIWGGSKIAWKDGVLSLSQLSLAGEDYQLALNGSFGNLAQGVTFDGQIEAEAQDVARFADLIGHPIEGAAQLSYLGKAVLLTQAFDGAIALTTTDLALGIPALDSSLEGAARIDIQAARGETGIALRAFALRARGVTADLSGRIAAAGVAVEGEFALLDVPAAQRGFGGTLSGSVSLSGIPMDALARITARTANIDLPVAMLHGVAAASADISAEIAVKNLFPQLQAAHLTSAALNADVSAAIKSGSYDVRIALANLGLVLPEFPGAMALAGTVAPQRGGAEIDVTLTGPAGLNAAAKGQVSAGQGNDLRLIGGADAGLINSYIAPRSIAGAARFDLVLRGAPALSNLSGSATLENGRLADPSLPFSLGKMKLQADLAGGQISLAGSANATTGGSFDLEGSIASSAPFDAELKVRLNDVRLRDPDLYDTSVAGKLLVKGPLTGGARLAGTIDLGRTEVQLRPTDASTVTLPDLRHRGDTDAVQQTRHHAGFDQRTAVSAPAAPFGLNIVVRAPNRLFVRGRGLDAELGGELRLGGTTNDVRPAGAFDLVQGRFDILGKRLDLEEVRLEMQGQLIPFLSVRATNQRGEVATTVIIDGPATDPSFSFTSSPEMPQEEVLAALLFDQNLQGLSPLQAVQLTGAIATLSGRGDGLIGRIRRALKLDNLDMQTSSSGKTALKMGKYLSDNVYSELSGDSDGQQSIDFTYTLNSKLKLRAGTETTGNTSLGIEYETNY
jgi:translocation and assembly module TamB